MDQTDHIILTSGGLASFEATRRVVNKIGRENVKLWFFDTLIEDEDLYRFLNDQEKYFELKIEHFCEGRNPWQVFKDKKYIGNSRVDICSRLLKREFLERVLRTRYPNKNIVLYFGLECTENHRITIVRSQWLQKGYRTEFPLESEPLLFPGDFEKIIEGTGIKVPRLYKLGFPHNNCGGACVKAGIQQWSLLWYTFPQRYLWHEAQEQEVRHLLNKNIAILRSRKGGKVRPMTLRFLRWQLRQENGNVSNIQKLISSMPEEWPCSCFTSLSGNSMDI